MTNQTAKTSRRRFLGAAAAVAALSSASVSASAAEAEESNGDVTVDVESTSLQATAVVADSPGVSVTPCPRAPGPAKIELEAACGIGAGGGRGIPVTALLTRGDARALAGALRIAADATEAGAPESIKKETPTHVTGVSGGGFDDDGPGVYVRAYPDDPAGDVEMELAHALGDHGGGVAVTAMLTPPAARQLAQGLDDAARCVDEA
jgi:hypothetical protein